MPLLVLRAYIYSSLGWQYFLIDFCYWSNAACLAQLFLFPASERLFLVNFLHTTGPLAMAIPTWRNSLVFHSLDKVTSVFIHMLPPLLAFSMRWYPPPHLELGETLHYGSALLVALGGYAAWQAFYLLCTEWLFRPNPSRMTSIRMLTLPAKDKAPPQCCTSARRRARTPSQHATPRAPRAPRRARHAARATPHAPLISPTPRTTAVLRAWQIRASPPGRGVWRARSA